jgi:hypothetical protein
MMNAAPYFIAHRARKIAFSNASSGMLLSIQRSDGEAILLAILAMLVLAIVIWSGVLWWLVTDGKKNSKPDHSDGKAGKDNSVNPPTTNKRNNQDL